MKKTLLVGKVSHCELKQAQSGSVFLNMKVEESFINQEGKVQIITNYVVAFNDYILSKAQEGWFQQGVYVVVEGDMRAESFTKQDGNVGTSQKIIATSISNVDVRQLLATQQPAATAPTTTAPTATASNQVIANPTTPSTGVTIDTNANQNGQVFTTTPLTKTIDGVTYKINPDGSLTPLG